VKVVLDTNEFVSGVFFRGPPHRILQAWRDGRLRLVVSPEILDEYQQVAEELASRYQGIDLTYFLRLLVVHAHLVQASSLGQRVCQDPDDEKFLACALAGGVTCVVTGDKRLLEASGHEGIEIIKARTFVDRYLTDRP
jgi:putative PIN family toxin of toxin-antitoxin system